MHLITRSSVPVNFDSTDKFGVIICTRDIESENFQRTMRFLADQEWPIDSFLCVVMNYGNVEDGFPTLSGVSLPEVPLVLSRETRQGFASARNAGLSISSKSRGVLFLDDDTIVESGWIMEMWNAHLRSPATVLGSMHDRLEIMPTDQAEMDAAASMIRSRKNATLSGSNGLFIPLGILGELQFSETYNQSGGEDTDLLTRLALIGHVEVAVDCIAVEQDRLLLEYWMKDAGSAYRGGSLWLKINNRNGLPTLRIRFRACVGIVPALVIFLLSTFQSRLSRRLRLRVLMRRIGVVTSSTR